MKTIKNLKQICTIAQEKGYTLNQDRSLNFSDYDIKNILENNIRIHKENCIKKYNKLKLDNIKNIDIFNKERTLKDFAEIEKEIKTYFKSFTDKNRISELIKKVNINTNYYFKEKWSLYDYHKNHSQEDFLKDLQEKIKKELVFKLHYSYGFNTSLYEFFNRFNQLVKLLFNKEIDFNLNTLPYKADIKEFETLINSSQNVYIVRLFNNGNVKISFKDIKQFETLKELYINYNVELNKKEFYISFENGYKNDNKRNDLILYSFNDVLFINVKLNLTEKQEIEKKYMLYSLEDLKKYEKSFRILHTYKTDIKEYSLNKVTECEQLTADNKKLVIAYLNVFYAGVKNEWRAGKRNYTGFKRYK